MLRLFLQQTNQPGWVNVIFLGKLDRTAFLVAFQFSNAQLLCLLAQTRDIQQIARRVRQQAETVDQLYLELLQLVFVFALAMRL